MYIYTFGSIDMTKATYVPFQNRSFHSVEGFLVELSTFTAQISGCSKDALKYGLLIKNFL